MSIRKPPGTQAVKDKIDIALIYGSSRTGRLCDCVAEWADEQIWDRDDFRLYPPDPAALSPATLQENGDTPELTALRKRIDRADAFVVVTPEYNHSYPAALKSLIDAVHGEWQAKPVGFVSYGGVSSGLRAVEHLRLVFVELHAVTTRDTVSFAGIWDHLDASGALIATECTERTMSRLLTQLGWWARALRTACTAVPYEPAVA